MEPRNLSLMEPIQAPWSQFGQCIDARLKDAPERVLYLIGQRDEWGDKEHNEHEHGHGLRVRVCLQDDG